VRRIAPLVLAAGAACSPASPAPKPAPAPPPKSAFRDLVMTAEQCKEPPRASISLADAHADVTVVQRILERGWAGLETRAAEGADPKRAIVRVRLLLDSSRDPVAVPALRDALADALKPVAADGHLAFFGYTTSAGHEGRKSAGRRLRAFTIDAPPGARVESCAGHDSAELLKPTLDEKLTRHLRPIVLAEETPKPASCRVRAGDAVTTADFAWRPLRGSKPKDPRAPVFELRPGAVPRVTQRSFWSTNESQLADFVASAKTMRETRAILVDLRGNEGGGDSWPKGFVAELTSETVEGYEVSRLDSDVTRQGIINTNTCDLQMPIDDAATKKDLLERLAYGEKVVADAEARGQPLREWRHRKGDERGRAERPYAGTLVILADGACASACESFIAYARQLPRTVVLGENTAGVGQFAEVLVYRLPKSGLGMSAGMKAFKPPRAGADFAEGRGYLPDLWLDVDDPLALAERAAACAAEPSCPVLAPRARPE
jgi:hypothetical protein